MRIKAVEYSLKFKLRCVPVKNEIRKTSGDIGNL